MTDAEKRKLLLWADEVAKALDTVDALGGPDMHPVLDHHLTEAMRHLMRLEEAARNLAKETA